LIDDHLGCAPSGLSSYVWTLVEQARPETQNHRFTYVEPMPVEAVVPSVADQALDFSDSDKEKKRSMARPFEFALLIAGFEFR
jgi:20S proteasome subunit alpha 5